MIRGLVKIANKLDSSGLVKEADILDSIIRKVANDPEFNPDNSTEFDWDFKNSPEGIGTTEPIYDEKTPEEKLLAKLEALEIINGMNIDEFESFVTSLSEEQQEVLRKMFGENSITPSYRVKNFGIKNSYEE